MSEPTRVYSSDDITVEWRRELCVHCGACTAGLPAVFNIDARPWVNIEGASPQAIANQVAMCPSGALSLGDAKD